MKITVTIYNDDESHSRDIQVISLITGEEPKRAVIKPGESGNLEQFNIIRGDILIVSATGD